MAMSPKTVKRAVAAKKRRKSGLSGMLAELYLKEYDAQRRLGNNTCIFIKVGDQQRFLVLSDNPPEVQNHGRFFTVFMGASTSEIGEATDILGEIKGSINDVYSPQDFHSTVALYFLSRYLKGAVEEFWSQRALAVEFMIFDPVFEVLHTIKFNGDYESYAIGEVKDTFILLGAYNPKLRRELAKDLQACLDSTDISKEKMKELRDKFCQKYNLQVSALFEPELIRVPASNVKVSAVPPE